MIERLRRVTDLFVEGTEVYLGQDDKHQPVVIWVNKLNSFETEEARRDGMVRRGQRMIELTKDDNPEFTHMRAVVSGWTDEQLRRQRVDQRAEEIYLDVVNDLQGEEDWREKVAILRRMPTLLDDEKADADDPRRQEVEDLQTGYLTEIRKRQEAKQKETLQEYAGTERDDLEKEFYDGWRERMTLDDFMQDRRITELYYAMRDCYATEIGRDENTGKLRFDHGKCNHTVRLLDTRAQVRDLPEDVLNKVIDTIDDLSVNQRESGNSDAPASSSASSEPQSEEEGSPASTPVETSHGARMT